MAPRRVDTVLVGLTSGYFIIVGVALLFGFFVIRERDQAYRKSGPAHDRLANYDEFISFLKVRVIALDIMCLVLGGYGVLSSFLRKVKHYKTLIKVCLVALITMMLNALVEGVCRLGQGFFSIFLLETPHQCRYIYPHDPVSTVNRDLIILSATDLVILVICVFSCPIGIFTAVTSKQLTIPRVRKLKIPRLSELDDLQDLLSGEKSEDLPTQRLELMDESEPTLFHFGKNPSVDDQLNFDNGRRSGVHGFSEH